jgi:L-fuculose-phosphate aldolase
MTYKTQREDIIEVGKRLYARNYVASNDGNISIRLDETTFMITPSGVSKGYMDPEDLLVVDMEGNVLEGNKKPSSEMKMHREVFSQRPDVQAIVHAHPQMATSFAVAHKVFDKIILPEIIFSLGKVCLADYGTPTTEQIPQAVARCIHETDALLLANHGALTVGSDIYDAYYKMETLEHFACIYFNVIQLGGGVELERDEIDTLYDIRDGVYGKKTLSRV